MAFGFVKKTWKDRISEYPTRRTLTKDDGSTELVTVSRSEGTVSQEGDAFSADNMNDLETRVDNALTEANSNLTNALTYHPETDCFGFEYEGSWVDVLSANLQAYYLFKSGIGLQNGITAQTTGYGTITITNGKIYCSQTSNYSEVTFSLDCTQFSGSGKKLYLEIMLDNSLSDENLIGFSASITSSSSIKTTSLTDIPANTRKIITIDIDTYCVGSYKYPIMALKNNNISIFNAYVK